MILLDTNVISELRKGSRANANVTAWFETIDEDTLFVSVLVVGELRRGIELVRRRDAAQATALEGWLATLIHAYAERVLGISVEVADAWARFNVPDPLPVIDSLMAATAHVHGLTLATRNVKDIQLTGVALVNPFDAPR